MPEPDLLTTFRFEARLGGAAAGAGAAFSEVSGLEINLESIEVREGGFNSGVRRLVGKASSPPLVLKRGVSTDRAFWEWVQSCLGGRYPLPYVDGEVVQRGPPPASAQATWRFTNGIATKVKAADLNATSSNVPIEELHIVHEGLERQA